MVYYLLYYYEILMVNFLLNIFTWKCFQQQIVKYRILGTQDRLDTKMQI